MGDDMKDKHRKNIFPLEHDGLSPTQEDTPEITADDDPQDRTELVSVKLREWTQSRASLARQSSRLEASREDVQRAVAYARELEEECDRLGDLCDKARRQRESVQSELDEERGRRRELEEQAAFIIEKLETLSGIRGRYHLERGRREQSDELTREQAEKINKLQRQVEVLTEALEEARSQGFRAELGPLTLELKT